MCLRYASSSCSSSSASYSPKLEDILSDSSWHFPTSSGMTIVHCNVQGCLSSHNHVKLDHLRDLLGQHNSPNIFYITKTKLSSKICNSEISIPGYVTHMCNRTRHGGGVAIYSKQSLRPCIISDIESSLEIESIKAFLSNGKASTICCVYRPLSSDASWIHSFYAYISQLTLVTSSCVIVSDLNYDLLKSAFSDELTVSFDLKQLICSPTRITATSATLIDHIYTYNVKSHICGITELHFADHLATFCVIDAHKDKASQRHLVTRFRSFKSLDAQFW